VAVRKKWYAESSAKIRSISKDRDKQLKVHKVIKLKVIKTDLIFYFIDFINF